VSCDDIRGEDAFWALIAANVRVHPDGAVDVTPLSAALAAMPPEAIVAFGRRSSELFARSRTWSLWGAASVIHDGAPDDTFDYFRSWLLARGRAVFEAALRDPDSLADVATPEALDDLLYRVAGVAYEEATGDALPGEALRYPPLGRRWDLQDPTEQERRYPRLVAWARGRRPATAPAEPEAKKTKKKAAAKKKARKKRG
jgi:hypothetical protein